MADNGGKVAETHLYPKEKGAGEVDKSLQYNTYEESQKEHADEMANCGMKDHAEMLKEMKEY